MTGHDHQQLKIDKLLNACKKAFDFVDDFDNCTLQENASRGLYRILQEAIDFAEGKI